MTFSSATATFFGCGRELLRVAAASGASYVRHDIGRPIDCRKTRPHHRPSRTVAVNVANASRMCGLSERKIQDLVERKTLKSVFAGGRRLVFVSSIREFLGLAKTSETA